MIKEKRNEVEVVLAVVNEYLNEGKDIPCEVMKYVVQELNKLEENYNKTINDLMNCNSLVVKMEQLFNLIGTIGTISIEDEDKLDKTLFNLENYVKNGKHACDGTSIDDAVVSRMNIQSETMVEEVFKRGEKHYRYTSKIKPVEPCGKLGAEEKTRCRILPGIDRSGRAVIKLRSPG